MPWSMLILSDETYMDWSDYLLNYYLFSEFLPLFDCLFETCWNWYNNEKKKKKNIDDKLFEHFVTQPKKSYDFQCNVLYWDVL